MPLIDFSVPFLGDKSADVDQACDHNLRWLQEHGLLQRSSEVSQRYLSQNIAELAAMAWPHARSLDLSLVLDLVSWSILFDDLVEKKGPSGRAEVHRVCKMLIGLTSFDHLVDAGIASPFLTSWRDLWNRFKEGMSNQWQRRAAQSWRDFLMAHSQEMDERETNNVPTEVQYFAVRRQSIFVPVFIDAVERVGQFELSQSTFECSEIQSLRNLTLELSFLINDVHSLEKEEAVGDTHNIVIIFEHHRSMPRELAIAMVLAMANERFERFIQEKERILSKKHWSPEERTTLISYIEGIEKMLRGAHDWQRLAPRFRGASPPLQFGGGASSTSHVPLEEQDANRSPTKSSYRGGQ